MHLRQLRVVFRFGLGITVLRFALQHWIIPKVRVLEHSVDSIEAEASDAAAIPPAGDIEHCFFDGRITPVQIGLLGIEDVVVPLVSGGIELPGRAAEHGYPAAGRLARASPVAPDVPVAMVGGLDDSESMNQGRWSRCGSRRSRGRSLLFSCRHLSRERRSRGACRTWDRCLRSWRRRSRSRLAVRESKERSR